MDLGGMGISASLKQAQTAESLREPRVLKWLDDAVAKPTSADLSKISGDVAAVVCWRWCRQRCASSVERCCGICNIVFAPA